MLVQIDDAYNLAHWLLRDRGAAEDAVQEAMLRALTYFHTFKGINARAWLLQIVRNVVYEHTNLSRGENTVSIDSDKDGTLSALREESLIDPADGPESTFIKQRQHDELMQALQRMPLELRECIVLRELEELSYREIADITQAPIGTVMSRLWRARQTLLRQLLAEGC